MPKDGKEASLTKQLTDAGLATTQTVVHDVSVIEYGRGDTNIDSVS
jgi:hypothetical protein